MKCINFFIFQYLLTFESHKFGIMNHFGKYFLGVVALVIIGFLCWYFSSIIAYILIAAVISFIGKPLIDLLGRVEIRGYRLQNGLKAAVTLVA